MTLESALKNPFGMLAGAIIEAAFCDILGPEEKKEVARYALQEYPKEHSPLHNKIYIARGRMIRHNDAVRWFEGGGYVLYCEGLGMPPEDIYKAYKEKMRGVL